MPSRKNQHFVPKAHLRPFSTDLNRKTISLFHIKSGRLIHGAGIDGQCSRSYFYGKDGKIEEMLGEVEGKYAEAVRNAEARTFDSGDMDWVRLFMAVQYGRTEAAAEQIKEFYARSSAVTFRGLALPEKEKPTMDPHQIVMRSLIQMRAMLPYMKDLAFRIFENQTPIPFVTSDNPLINTNRFYCQRIGEDTWGAMSAGALFILPLGPRHLACFLDAAVYKIAVDKGYIELRKKNDVIAFNEMQYLNAAENIYFSNPDDGERVAQEFDAVKTRRITERTRLTEFLAKKLPSGRERLTRFKPGMDERKFDSKYVMYNVPRPIPARWPAVFSFRMKPVAYTNGSSAGYVRHREWLNGVKPE